MHVKLYSYSNIARKTSCVYIYLINKTSISEPLISMYNNMLMYYIAFANIVYLHYIVFGETNR